MTIRPRIRPLRPAKAGPRPPRAAARGAPQPKLGPAAEMQRIARSIAALSGALGTPPASTTDDGEVVDVEIDPLAVAVAHGHLQALPGEPAVVKRSGVSAGRLGSYLGQRSEMVKLHLTARQLQRDVSDSRLVTGARQRRLARRLARTLRELLSSDALAPADREQLRSDAAEFLSLYEREEAERARLGQATRRSKATTAERLGAANRRARAIDTMLDLREGRPVPDEDVLEAAAYAGLDQEERRDRAR